MEEISEGRDIFNKRKEEQRLKQIIPTEIPPIQPQIPEDNSANPPFHPENSSQQAESFPQQQVSGLLNSTGENTQNNPTEEK